MSARNTKVLAVIIGVLVIASVVVSLFLIAHDSAQVIGNPICGHKKLGWVYSVAWSPHASRFASGGDDGSVLLYEPDGDVSRLSGHSDSVTRVVYASDQVLLSASCDGTVRVWNVNDRREVGAFAKHTDCVFALTVTRDERLVASAGHDAVIRVWQLKNQELTQSLVGHERTVRDLCLSPDESRLYSIGSDDSIRCWNFLDGQPLWKTTITDVPKCGICVGDVIAVGRLGGIVLVGGSDGRLITEVSLGSSAVTQLAAHEGSDLLWIATEGDGLWSCDISDPTNVVVVQSPLATGGIASLAASPNGRLLLGGYDGCVTIQMASDSQNGGASVHE